MVRGYLCVLASEEGLLQQPLVDHDLEPHSVFDTERGQKVNKVSDLIFHRELKRLARVSVHVGKS